MQVRISARRLAGKVGVLEVFLRAENRRCRTLVHKHVRVVQEPSAVLALEDGNRKIYDVYAVLRFDMSVT